MYGVVLVPALLLLQAATAAVLLAPLGCGPASVLGKLV